MGKETLKQEYLHIQASNLLNHCGKNRKDDNKSSNKSDDSGRSRNSLSKLVVNQQSIGTIKKHNSEKYKDYYLQKADGEIILQILRMHQGKILILMMMTVKCYYFYF